MIDPTSRDNPKFKELVKVRRASCLRCSFWGTALGVQAPVGEELGRRAWCSAGRGVCRGGAWMEEGVKVTVWTPPRCPSEPLAYTLLRAGGAAGGNRPSPGAAGAPSGCSCSGAV